MLSKAKIPAIPNNDVIENFDRNGGAGGFDFLRYCAVFDAGFGAAGGVVVDEDEGGGVVRDGGPYDFARVDGGFIDGAFEKVFLTDDAVGFV